MTTVIDPASASGAAELIELHRRACAATGRFVAGIKPDQWQNACTSEGDVRGLVNHLVGGQRLTVELLHGRSEREAGPELAGDLLGADPLAAYDSACALAQAAWEEPGALARSCRMEQGDRPAAQWASIRVMDVFVHGWDLAVATGQDDQLDPALTTLVYEEWKPREEMLRGSG